MLQTRFATLLHLLHQEQRGQVLVLVAGLLAVFGGMTAIAVDLGSYSAARRDLQNSTDAIALAASLELPDASAAQAVAQQWAIRNGIEPSDMHVTVIPQNIPFQANPEVQVEVNDEHGFTFARLIGISSATVTTSAAAIKTSPAGGEGMVPLSVTQDALTGAGLGDEVILKYDANDIDQGNTSPIRIDDPGTGNCVDSDAFCDGVMNGSDTVICADGSDGTYCDGVTVVDTQPGVIMSIRTAIDWRITETDSHCDEFTEVFEDDPTTTEADVYRITWECNPFLEGGYDSYRIMIVPVIEELCSAPQGGSCEVTIVDFALVFLEGYGEGGCGTGNDCQIVGRFVRVNQNIGLLAGTFNPEAFNHFVRLVK